jgi:hypothetical protein
MVNGTSQNYELTRLAWLIIDESISKPDEFIQAIKNLTSKMTAMMKRMMEIVRNSFLMYLKFAGAMDAWV